MTLQHFVIPLTVDGGTHRASLVLDDTGTKGSIRYNQAHVCDFELETAWSVPDYFVAEKLTRVYLLDIMGIEAEQVPSYGLPTLHRSSRKVSIWSWLSGRRGGTSRYLTTPAPSYIV